MDLSSSDVAVVLGSGLSQVASDLVPAQPVPYTDLGLPSSGVPGHEGRLYAGRIEGKRVLAFAGRAHLYEGHDARTVTRAVRGAAEAGCRTVILTNAAGGVDPGLRPGDLCVITDHLNLTGTNPLIGTAPEVARNFLDMTDAYDPGLRGVALEVDPALREAVYAGLPGPSYETPAEVRMLRTLGADLVGMSTVLEAIAARREGARVLGLSLVTNVAAGLSNDPVDHDAVTSIGEAGGARLGRLLRGVIERL